MYKIGFAGIPLHVYKPAEPPHSPTHISTQIITFAMFFSRNIITLIINLELRNKHKVKASEQLETN